MSSIEDLDTSVIKRTFLDRRVIDLKKKKLTQSLSVKQMKERVRMMKKKDANAPETKKAVQEMMELQKMVKELKLKFGDDEKKKLPTCDKEALDALLQRRMFIVPSFDIYGGVKGLYVYSLYLSLSLSLSHSFSCSSPQVRSRTPGLRAQGKHAPHVAKSFRSGGGYVGGRVYEHDTRESSKDEWTCG